MSYEQPGINRERIVAIDKLFNIQDTVAFSFCFACLKMIANNKMRIYSALETTKCIVISLWLGYFIEILLKLSAVLYFITHLYLN